MTDERARGGEAREAGEIRRTLLLAAALTRTAGADAAARAVPLFGGIGVLGAILFAGNGMNARDVTGLADRSAAVRIALWAAWVAAATPLARALLAAPGAVFLRSLPIARWRFLAIAAAHLLALQAPWALLWGRGAGIERGLAAAIVAAGAEVLIVARPREMKEIVAAAMLVAGAVAALPVPVTLACGAIAGWIALRAAWARAPDRPPDRLSLVRGPMPIALALSYVARLVRIEGSPVIRAIFVSALGGALAGLGARNNGATAPAELAGFSLAVTATFLVIAAGGLAGPVRAAEREIGWLLDTTAARPWLRVLAARSAVGAAGAMLGVIAGATAAVASGTEPIAGARVTLENALFGAAIGALCSEAAARAERHGKPDGGRLVAWLALIALSAIGAAAMLGEAGTAVIAAIAAIAAALGARASRRGERPYETSVARKSERERTMILEVNAVRKRFGGHVVLDGVTLSWPGPGVQVIRGENGAGKSTLLRIVAGVLEKDAGDVSIGGASLDAARERALAQAGWVPDVADLPRHLVTRELLSLIAALKRARPPEATLVDRLGVRPLMGERLGALSLGQRRRVGLLSALIGDPALLVLDEPTNGLDADGLGTLVELLRERTRAGLSALVATHDRGFIGDVGGATVTLERGRVSDLRTID